MSELTKLRTEIDQLDTELLQILSKRFIATRRIGNLKRQNSLPFTDESRLNQILQQWRNAAEDLMINPELAKSILLIIHDYVIQEHVNEN